MKTTKILVSCFLILSSTTSLFISESNKSPVLANEIKDELILPEEITEESEDIKEDVEHTEELNDDKEEANDDKEEANDDKENNVNEDLDEPADIENSEGDLDDHTFDSDESYDIDDKDTSDESNTELSEEPAEFTPKSIDDNIAVVKSDSEFYRAFNDGKITTIRVNNDIDLIYGKGLSLNRSEPLKIEGNNKTLNIKKPNILSAYPTTMVIGNDFFLENVKIKTHFNGAKNSLFSFGSDQVTFNNVTMSTNNWKIMTGTISEKINILNSDIEVSGIAPFTVGGAGDNTAILTTVNLSNSDIRFTDKSDSEYMFDVYNGSFKFTTGEGTANLRGGGYLFNSRNSLIRLDGFKSAGDGLVTDKYIINAPESLIMDSKITARATGNEKTGLFSGNNIIIDGSTINTPRFSNDPVQNNGSFTNFISVDSHATITDSNFKVKVEKDARLGIQTPGFFDGPLLRLDKVNLDIATSTVAPFNIFRLKKLDIANGSEIYAKVEDRSFFGSAGGFTFPGAIINTDYGDNDDEVLINVGGASKVYLESNAIKSTIKIGKNRQITPAKMDITGGSTLHVKQNSGISDNGEAVIKMLGNSKQESNEANGVFVSEGSDLIVEGMGRLFMSDQKYDSILSVSDDHSNMYFKQIGKTNTPAIDFRNGGNSILVRGKGNFKLDAAEVGQAGIVMKGGNNLLQVSEGGHLDIHKLGSRDFMTNSTYAALQFEQKNNVFLVADRGSYINMLSEQGPVIIGAGGGLDFKAFPEINVKIIDEGSFIARGKTGGTVDDWFNAAGIIQSSKFSFYADNPGYFDLSNKKNGGAPVFSTNSIFDLMAENSFDLNDSHLSVWGKDSNQNGDPDHSWYKVQLGLTGRKFNTVNKIDSQGVRGVIGQDGLVQYSRINANNLTPEVKGLYKASDTDQYIYGRVIVPDLPDYSDYRGAWTDEVLVSITHYDDQNRILREIKDVPTVALSDVESKGYKLYDFDSSGYLDYNLGGLFRVDVSEFGDTFANAGDKFEITSAKKVIKFKEGTQEKIEYLDLSLDSLGGEFEGLDYYPKVDVVDKTPIVPAKVTSILIPTSEFIEGESAEDGKVYLFKEGHGTISETQSIDGKWKLEIPNELTLRIGDEYRIILEDTAGNKNPLDSLNWHDAIFDEATRINVEKQIYEITGNNIIFNLNSNELNQLRNIDQLIDDSFMNVKYTKEGTECNVDTNTFEIINVDGFDFINHSEGTFKFRFILKEHNKIFKDLNLIIVDNDKLVIHNDFAIAANDFSGDRNTYKLSSDELISKASAIGYDLITGEEVNIIIKDNELSGSLGEQGTYRIDFAIEDDESCFTDINVRIYDYDNVVETKTSIIMANNFKKKDYEINGSLSNEEIIYFSQAVGYLKAGNDLIPVDVVVDEHNIISQEGIYYAKLSLVAPIP